ncbi:uncharacterized protein C8Q71DRAFT_761054 [Rhodofomes roseus]|uniref:Uncharacterized protein n=1 Tax=Rhodofomes roseus TaxID=34475 RepID=A0ABQ8KEK5_9APHY|nr:uncharacterized protein C8Q71DRAFT_761054 [Rhodofomes roseus]KAH9836174.1 hypothetical protein C8Q71DRAFT_761054 [Rhodofomes roseus]
MTMARVASFIQLADDVSVDPDVLGDPDRKLVDADIWEHSDDEGLPNLPPIVPPTAASPTSDAEPHKVVELMFDGGFRNPGCRKVYQELFGAAGDRPVHVQALSLCACFPFNGQPPCGYGPDPDDDSDGSDGSGHDEDFEDSDERGNVNTSDGPDAEDVYSLDEHEREARHLLIRKATRIVCRLDKVESLQLKHMMWADVHIEARAVLSNPAYFNGLTMLHLWDVNFATTSQLMRVLELVTAHRVIQLTVGRCLWEVNNHHRKQVASRLPLRLKRLELSEADEYNCSWRPVVQWLLGKREVLSVKEADVVLSSLDITPLIDLIRKTACGMRCFHAIFHTFESEDADLTDEDIRRLRDEPRKPPRRGEDRAVRWYCLPDDIVNRQKWSYGLSRARALKQCPTMEQAHADAEQALRDDPILNSTLLDIEVLLDWTALAITGLRVVRQLICSATRRLRIELRIRDFERVEWSLLNDLFSDIDKAFVRHEVSDVIEYSVQIWIEFEKDSHEELHDMVRRKLPSIYRSSVKPKVSVHGSCGLMPPVPDTE